MKKIKNPTKNLKKKVFSIYSYAARICIFDLLLVRAIDQEKEKYKGGIFSSKICLHVCLTPREIVSRLPLFGLGSLFGSYV